MCKANSIFDLMMELEPAQWDYRYKETNGLFQLPTFQDFNSTEFLGNYFSRAGKENMEPDELGIYGTYPRADHTVSIFILGVILYHKTKFNGMFCTDTTHAGYQLFPFLWFLTCLFHDFAWDYEQKGIDNLENLKDVKKLLQIDNDLLKRKLHHLPPGLLKLIEPYFEYRRLKKKSDHRIIGGLYLFDRLVKNRERKSNDKPKDRFWHISLEKFYADACASIAVHNIWFKDTEVVKYIKCKFGDDLSKIEKVSVTKSPLLFLLGLVDTLDPFKIFNCASDKMTILNDVCLSFENHYFQITVKDGSLLNSDCLKAKMGALDWLDIKTESIRNGISINLNT